MAFIFHFIYGIIPLTFIFFKMVETINQLMIIYCDSQSYSHIKIYDSTIVI